MKILKWTFALVRELSEVQKSARESSDDPDFSNVKKMGDFVAFSEYLNFKLEPFVKKFLNKFLSNYIGRLFMDSIITFWS